MNPCVTADPTTTVSHTSLWAILWLVYLFIYFLVSEAIFSLAAEISSHCEFHIGSAVSPRSLPQGSAQLTEQTALQSLKWEGLILPLNLLLSAVAGWILLLTSSYAYYRKTEPHRNSTWPTQLRLWICQIPCLQLYLERSSALSHTQTSVVMLAQCGPQQHLLRAQLHVFPADFKLSPDLRATAESSHGHTKALRLLHLHVNHCYKLHSFTYPCYIHNNTWIIITVCIYSGTIFDIWLVIRNIDMSAV